MEKIDRQSLDKAPDELLTKNRTIEQNRTQEPKKFLMKSYKAFLRQAEDDVADDDTYYVRIPKKLVIDPRLTQKERQLWGVLAAFLYKPTSDIFPGRRRLAKLLNVQNPTSISRLTRSLQRKGYVTKYYNTKGKIIYELWFQSNLDDSAFTGDLTEKNDELYPSPYNNPNLGRPPKTRGGQGRSQN